MAKLKTPDRDVGNLPGDLAAGPVVDVWGPAGRRPELADQDWRERDAHAAWLAAGEQWSVRHIGNESGWIRLLADDVYAAAFMQRRLRRPRSGAVQNLLDARSEAQ